MRRPVIIYDCDGWTLSSQGNGAFYTLARDGKSVFFQGDDALQFESEYEAACVAGCVASFFANYSEVMT